MGGPSGSSSTTTNAGDPFSDRFRTVGDLAAAFAAFKRVKCDAHVQMFQRLNTPHDGHVQAWRAWKARPWTWRNNVAAAINGFINWLEGG